VSALRWLRACCVAAFVGGIAPAHASNESQEAASFDYYVLALSWAPTFCASHPADRAECGLRRGFVAHGLWPQYAGGGGPEHCSGADALDQETVEHARAAMPDERLIHHEWVVHGTCSGLTPHDYFATLIRAIGRLSIPSEFDGEAAHTMTASQIVAAFTKANPSMTGRSLVLRCRGAQLEEVRICLSRNLKPQPCGPDIRRHCRSGPLTIGTLPSPAAPLPR
jgi:ribonuclease T2